MQENTNRAEGERLLGIAEKLLQSRDLNGSKDFAILAQETEPLLDGSDQILAVVDVLLASERRINNHHDWYAILQLDRRCDDLELLKKQYRRLALLLHPDKNKFAFADSAFKLVADAWAVLSDSGKKSLFDNELGLFSKVDLVAMKRQKDFFQQQPDQQKLPVRRSSWMNTSGRNHSDDGGGTATPTPTPTPTPTTPTPTRASKIWTACPYCYNLYEYPRAYEGCCLRCQNCQRAFHAAEIPSLPPLVPGKEAYYCCWGFFPIGFVISNSEAGKDTGLPTWMPPTAKATAAGGARNGGADTFADVRAGNAPPPKKRGRPRKNV